CMQGLAFPMYSF
nr:immunoglobulin light chain junction region [Macaca mulatta]MOW11890.1 immunoglobulin light chain junction region [Macaca mulatta]